MLSPITTLITLIVTITHTTIFTAITTDALSHLAAVLADQSYINGSNIENTTIEQSQRADKKAREKFRESIKLLREAGSIYSAGFMDSEDLGPDPGPEQFQGVTNPVILSFYFIFISNYFLFIFIFLLFFVFTIFLANYSCVESH